MSFLRYPDGGASGLRNVRVRDLDLTAQVARLRERNTKAPGLKALRQAVKDMGPSSGLHGLSTATVVLEVKPCSAPASEGGFAGAGRAG